ncbi:OprD family outer membrane porin [uncultured Desulfovibrio sp.]|uniref:OprD family outer membrane porin n=1 Tax=uncultured Desulfovibrio sp. TaxID=167968 RepID=UPI002673E2B0|nr:OprD family outer membrane porin [uncultured Desulfovibrio sp.]
MAEQQQRLVPGGFRTLRLLCLPALFWALLWALWPVHADAADVADSPDKGSPARTLLPEDSPLSPLVNDAHLSGGLYFFGRDRQRYDVDRKTYRTNLRHGSLQANLDLVSGYAWDHLGFDFGAFTSHDLFNYGAPDHEMGYVPWQDPWHPDWSRHFTLSGVSIYKAALKAKAGPAWLRAGWLQPEGPGVLGVNWSIMPGSWRGVNAGLDFGGFSVAGMVADTYKAPWFLDEYKLMKNDGESHVPGVWSLGARYAFDNGITLEAAYGQSPGHLHNAHFKSGWELPAGPGRLKFGYHLYAMADSDDGGGVNNNFDGLALQHYLFGLYELDMWTFRLEGTYTAAPMSGPWSQGQFAYRLADRNGGAKGAYEVWWDSRSDWNADDEKAVFAGVERRLDDILPVKGFYVGVSGAMGWDGRGWGTSERLNEWAVNGDLGYVKPDGPLEGAFVKLHYTEYRNGTDAPSWSVYKNGFQSEHDFKILIGLPFSF